MLNVPVLNFQVSTLQTKFIASVYPKHFNIVFLYRKFIMLNDHLYAKQLSVIEIKLMENPAPLFKITVPVLDTSISST